MADGKDLPLLEDADLREILRNDDLPGLQSIFWPDDDGDGDGIDPSAIFDPPPVSSNTCSRCKKWFSTGVRLQRHVEAGNCAFRETQRGNYHCPFPTCSTTCKTMYAMRRHTR